MYYYSSALVELDNLQVFFSAYNNIPLTLGSSVEHVGIIWVERGSCHARVYAYVLYLLLCLFGKCDRGCQRRPDIQ
jgi:hypothetical protein